MFLLYFYTLFSYQTSWQVFLYVYKWIHVHSTAVYICKEEYLILLIMLNWRWLLAQIFTNWIFTQMWPRMFLSYCGLVTENIFISECKMPDQRGFRNDSRLYIGALNHTNEFIKITEIWIPTSHLIANPSVHQIITVLFSFPSISVSFCPVCSFWC